MSEQTKPSTGVTPDRIDPHSSATVSEWAKKLDVTDDQIVEAVKKVGGLATDVEMHLKGTRSTTNSERIKEVDGKSV